MTRRIERQGRHVAKESFGQRALTSAAVALTALGWLICVGSIYLKSISDDVQPTKVRIVWLLAMLAPPVVGAILASIVEEKYANLTFGKFVRIVNYIAIVLIFLNAIR